MRDSVVFAEVRSLQGRDRSANLSSSALEIHVRSVMDRVGTTYPAFIPDERLDAVGPGRVTTIAALELCLAGLWYRAADGYVIADLDLVERLGEPLGRRRMRAVVRFVREFLSPL
jgi:hypothetical protein